MDRGDIVSAIADGLSEYCNCTTVKTCDECASNKLALYKKQVRAEVIDKVFKILEEEIDIIDGASWSRLQDRLVKMKEQK